MDIAKQKDVSEATAIEGGGTMPLTDETTTGAALGETTADKCPNDSIADEATEGEAEINCMEDSVVQEEKTPEASTTEETETTGEGSED